MRRRARSNTPVFPRFVRPVLLAVIAGTIVLLVKTYLIDRPPTPAEPLDSMFTLGLLMGQATASIIARFPDEDITPSEDYLLALRQNLSLIGHKAPDRVSGIFRRALQQANQTSEPEVVATLLGPVGEAKAEVQGFVADKHGRCAAYVLQLGVNLPYVRRSLITLHDLEVFYRRGELDSAEYSALLAKAISTVDPMVEFFRDAASSDCFDTNRPIRDAIAFVGTTNLFDAENRKRTWDALKEIAKEYHVPIPDYVTRPSPEQSDQGTQPSAAKDPLYETLLREARSLSGQMRPRSHSIEEVTDNIRKRGEVARRARAAMNEGRLSKAQCDSILFVLRQLGGR